MLLLIKRKLLKHSSKIDSMATGHNKATASSITINSINLRSADDGLIEVQVKGDVVGWIYNNLYTSATLLSGGSLYIVSMQTLRTFVEGKARESGKAESESPLAYHIRRDDGNVYYYITEQDFIDLEEYETTLGNDSK